MMTAAKKNGTVKIKGGKITDRWSTLVNAGNPIVGAQMHGITTADLKKGIAPKESAEKFADFAKGAILVGHNLGFDVSFLDEALGKGRSFATEQGQYLDTFVLFREAYPESESFKLGDLARIYGVKTAQRTAQGATQRQQQSCFSSSPQSSQSDSPPSRRGSATRSVQPAAGRVNRRRFSKRHVARPASERTSSVTCTRRRRAPSR